MKKIIASLILVMALFALLNFLYTNMTPTALGYGMVFRFRIPGLFTLRSAELPLGFILVTAFCLGIMFLSFVQALPELFRSLSYREQRRRIKELEKTLEQNQKQ